MSTFNLRGPLSLPLRQEEGYHYFTEAVILSPGVLGRNF
jgi:hypothetical protein